MPSFVERRQRAPVTVFTRAWIAAACAALALAGRPASALDAETALRQVADRNPALESRRAMVEAARRRVAPAGAWAAPMVEVGVLNVPTTWKLDMDPMTMKMVGVVQRVPVFGANRLQRRAATRAVAAEAASADATRLELLAAAWQAYTDAYFAERLAAEADAHRGVMDRLVASARARYASGNGRLEDALRAESERASVMADRAAYDAEARAARARLDALRGVAPGTAPESLAAPPRVPIARLLATPVDPAHPRLAASAAASDRYALAARAAGRMAWPDLELRASYGFRGRMADGMEQDDMVSATVGFMVPIFAGSREFSEAAEMRAMASSADADRRVAELALAEELESVRAELLGAERAESLLADTVVTTQRRALDASWSAYAAGMTDLWRVFESAHALYGEDVQLVRTRQQIARLQARLVTATGRTDVLGAGFDAVGGEPGRKP